MRKKHSYGSYRGRSGPGDVLKVVAVLLGLLLVLLVGVYFFMQWYVVYSDDGSVHLELPFFQEKEAEPTDLPPVELPEPELKVEVEIVPPEPVRTLPVSLPREALYDGTAAERVTEGGGTAALFDMKAETGELGWVSDQPLAVAAQVSGGDPAINVAVRAQAEDDGVYRIARIACFKDHLISNADTNMAILTNSGYRWTDPEKVRWVSPTSEKVRDYLTALCVELASLGFDEILLDYAGYPTEGNLHYIKKGEAYNAAEFETVISGFYAQIAAALEGTDTALSVVYDAQTAALSGQSEQGIAAAGAAVVVRDEAGVLRWPEP